jgi:hypothetical protein
MTINEVHRSIFEGAPISTKWLVRDIPIPISNHIYILQNCIKNEECIKKQKQQENQCCDQKKRRINAKPHASYHSSSNYSYELSMVL